MAGADGTTPPDFFARSAMVARYARFACRRRMHSMYSWLGLVFVGALDASLVLFDCSVEGDGEALWSWDWEAA